MPSGWIYGQHDRGLYIVQTGQKEKREEDVRLGRSFHRSKQTPTQKVASEPLYSDPECVNFQCRFCDCYHEVN